MMHNKDMMPNLAKDVSLLSSEYNVSFDKKHLVDLVSAFNGFDSDVKDFSDNLDIKAKPETKRKTLNVLFESDVDKQSTDDDDALVRYYVAEQGYGLDKLVDDEFYPVRCFAAEHGYGLDKLINDEEIFVRGSVAKQGYGLDILIDDGNRDVRMTVAHQGYSLDKLIDDDYWGVRAEIANQGYGLDKLIHDEEPKVRLLAYDALRAEEEQQKSNQQGKRRVLFVQDNYDDEIENSEFDFDV